jgi:dTDP-4-dehydrorhamnose reductase
MKVVITGGSGQLGRAFRQIWPEARFLTRSDLDLTQDFRVIKQTVQNLDPDIVINCAAYTNVDRAEVEPVLAYQSNAIAPEALASACRMLSPEGRTMVHISTDYVWGQADAWNSRRTTEEVPAPESVYGHSKWLGECAVLAGHQFGCQVIRTSGVFGEGNNYVKTMLALAKSQNRVAVVSDQIMRPTYAADLARAIRQMLERHGGRLPLRLMQIQNAGQPITWADFATEIFRQAGLATKVEAISTQEYRQREARRRKAAGIQVPVAPRPNNSVFAMPEQEKYFQMPDWQDALGAYLATLP